MLRRLNLLHRLHNRLLEIVTTAAPLIASTPEEADLVGLQHLRDEMVHTMSAYDRYIDEVLIAQAEASGDADLICRARAIQVGSRRLTDAYDAFRARWVGRNPLANWPEYRLSAMLMIKQLRQQVILSRDWLWLINDRATQVAQVGAATTPQPGHRAH